jgi:predicted Zn-dependent protease
MELMTLSRFCLFNLIVISSLLCGCTEKLVPDLPPVAAPEKPTLEQLKPDVDRLLASQDNVMIRRRIGDVFALVDLLQAAGMQDEELRYMEVALQHNAWALDYQMRYAELMGQRGDMDVARQKAKLVREYAEQDDLFERAQRLLGENLLPSVPAIQLLQGDAPMLVLVPVGDVDRCVLYDLSKELSAALSIPVILQDAHVRVPKFKRDPVQRHFAQVRTNLLAEIKQNVRLNMFLRQRGIGPKVLQNGQAVIAACRYLALESGGTNGLAQFDAGLRRLERMPKQWDFDELLSNLRTGVQPYLKQRIYFMGIANLDAYADQSNFLFGTAEKGGPHAMISYRRFTAEFNEENPNRKRLVERSLKQALSSFGFMLGVDRCSDPTCARAYPHNLEEHDAKARELCPRCRQAFEWALRNE